MPKFGSLTNPSKDIVKEITDIHKHGFDFAEVNIEAPTTPEIIAKRQKEVLHHLKKFDVGPVGHTAWWLDLGTEYKEIRKSTINEFKKSINISSKLGIRLMNIHASSYGTYSGDKTKIILNNFVSNLKELTRYASEKGMRIMLENVPDKRAWATLDSFKYVVTRVPGLNVHLDVGHAFVLDGMKEIKSYISFFGDGIEHIHIHDNHGNSDEHLGLGEGNIDFPTVVKELKKIDYDKTITFEVFSQFHKGKFVHVALPRNLQQKSMEYFKKLWVKA